MTASLSIVIPSHHRCDLLMDCLSSVVAHAPRGTEIIVVDDGSPQGSVSQTAERFVGVRVIRFQSSHGFCNAANAGIGTSSAPFIELLNDDTIVETGWAENALKAFGNPRVAAVAPLVLLGQPGDRPIIDSAGDMYHPAGYAQKRGHREPLDNQFAKFEMVDSASGCAAFYRREALERVGGFTETFGAYFEDVDLSCRLRRAGYEIAYVPDSRVWHLGTSSHNPLKRRIVQQQSCNEERVFWRNRSGTPSELLGHAAVLAGKAFRRVGEGKFMPWLFGRCRAWMIEGRNRWMSSPKE